MKRTTLKDVAGTSLQGYVHVSYAKLVRTFGKPHSHGDGYKVDAEWRLKASDGTVATIYNYKDGKSYLGSKGKPLSEIRTWHIGGRSPKAVSYVKKALG